MANVYLKRNFLLNTQGILNMEKLSIEQVEAVNGGAHYFILEFAVSYAAGKLLDAAIEADWGSASYSDMMIAP